MKRCSDAAIRMDVDMEGDGKDGKDGKDGEDKQGASLGRYKKCGITNFACGVCGAEWTGSHDWWYSNEACKWLCGKCHAKVPGWIDYKDKEGKEDCGKDKNTDGGGGGAGDTEMCVG